MAGVDEPPVAFAVPATERPALEIRVNFGVFAGRRATQAELDRLAARLLGEVASVTIVAEERYEVGSNVEASVHQVRIELPASDVPDDPLARLELETKLVADARAWAADCFADRTTGQG